MLLVINVG